MKGMDENTQNEIERYLYNEFNDEERTLFKQKMEADTALKEEVLLQKSIHNVLGAKKTTQNSSFKKESVEALKTLLKSEEYQEIQSNLKTNTTHYLERQQRGVSRKKSQYRIVLAIAAVFIAFIVITPFLNNSNIQNHYNEYADWNSIPSFIEKGVAEKKLTDIEQSYHSQDYFNVIKLIEALPEKSKTSFPNLFIYLGASYFHQNNYEKAMKTFNEFSRSEAYDHSKGFWYISLIYLKEDKLEEAKKVLKIIIKNDYFNYKKATQLLKEIE
jgi:hypothetical protein